MNSRKPIFTYNPNEKDSLRVNLMLLTIYSDQTLVAAQDLVTSPYVSKLYKEPFEKILKASRQIERALEQIYEYNKKFQKEEHQFMSAEFDKFIREQVHEANKYAKSILIDGQDATTLIDQSV